MMSDRKIYYTFLVILFSVAIIVNYAHTIFPIMGDDEYFVDEYNNIHGKNCPYKSVPWFTQKHSKYDFIKESGQDICRECLLYEEDKLMHLHKLNLNEEVLRLRRSGASEEYINDRIKQHERK